MEPDEFDRLLAAYDKVRRAHPDLARVVVSEGNLRLEATRTPTLDEPVVVMGTLRSQTIDNVVTKIMHELENVTPMGESDLRMFGGWLRNFLGNSDLDVLPEGAATP